MANETDFETKVIDSLGAIDKRQTEIQTEFKTAQEKILADYDRQSKELKTRRRS